MTRPFPSVGVITNFLKSESNKQGTSLNKKIHPEIGNWKENTNDMVPTLWCLDCLVLVFLGLTFWVSLFLLGSVPYLLDQWCVLGFPTDSECRKVLVQVCPGILVLFVRHVTWGWRPSSLLRWLDRSIENITTTHLSLTPHPIDSTIGSVQEGYHIRTQENDSPTHGHKEHRFSTLVRRLVNWGGHWTYEASKREKEKEVV